jgi:hypothetical protein
MVVKAPTMTTNSACSFTFILPSGTYRYVVHGRLSVDSFQPWQTIVVTPLPVHGSADRLCSAVGCSIDGSIDVIVRVIDNHGTSGPQRHMDLAPLVNAATVTIRIRKAHDNPIRSLREPTQRDSQASLHIGHQTIRDCDIPFANLDIHVSHLDVILTGARKSNKSIIYDR